MDFAELVYNMSGKVDEIVQLICQEVRDESYDYVIYDHHFLAGKIIAEMLGLPSVSLCTTFAMDETFAKTFTLQGDLESSPYFEKLKQSLGELSERYPVSLDKPFDVFSCPGTLRLSLPPGSFSLMPSDLEMTICLSGRRLRADRIQAASRSLSWRGKPSS